MFHGNATVNDHFQPLGHITERSYQITFSLLSHQDKNKLQIWECQTQVEFHSNINAKPAAIQRHLQMGAYARTLAIESGGFPTNKTNDPYKKEHWSVLYPHSENMGVKHQLSARIHNNSR